MWGVEKERRLPVFRFSKGFGIARGVRVFLNLEGGLVRGTPPDAGRNGQRAEKLEDARQLVREQRKTLEIKDRESQRQARDLRAERQRNHKHKRELREKRSEIFRLRNELDALNTLSSNVQDTPRGAPSAPEASGGPKIGALPDFVIIGAQRSGTGRLYGLLTRHPDVERASVKEVHYFDRPDNFRRGIEWYRRRFPARRRGSQRHITGEATPSYLVDPPVPERIAEAVPEVRLIVLLRDPVARAYSHFHMAYRKGNETRSFEEAVEEEQA